MEFKAVIASLVLCIQYTSALPSDCPLLNCLAIDCPGGFRTNENGCSTCECECPAYDCPQDLTCPNGFATDENGCTLCECHVCRVYRCRACPNGYRIDSNGCQTCECLPSSECPLLKCVPCPNGYVVNERGCPTCTCQTDTSV